MKQLMPPFFSICIPAYERVNYLRRLLDSIAEQTFRDFEVIISDDSKTDQVLALVKAYSDKLTIRYFQNSPSLGTPSNWNNAISKAAGQWIKLIHDDDWFASRDSLKKFAENAHEQSPFVFSAYANHFEAGHLKPEIKRLSPAWSRRIIRQPMALLAYNVIGPPSVTLIHRTVLEQYDPRFKWRVDMEFYVRLIKELNRFKYIDEILVNVGVSESQVTQSCIYQPTVELPEGLLLLRKHGDKPLDNVWVYDAWWRLLRNMEIFTLEKLEQYTNEPWPAIIQQMVIDLAGIPAAFLKLGVLSKAFMFASYLKNKSLISHPVS
ncbi:glycosyltransferase family 2 protein [Flavihumibacter fluvii]|uniref:glycosyltransferase family 2 protein n=1 Tax=Flavihumibacter fluvii TaxID=2838157 RepID=UPI001BDF6BC1|nr:glycosyltransferase [Flavihumibacter fluvii]ULQ53784.1 glycosyltransferase [Flavihumibacter fluvii]